MSFETSGCQSTPSKNFTTLDRMLFHTLMEATGEVVAVSTTSGDTYSGILFAVEANPKYVDYALASSSTLKRKRNHCQREGAWNHITLKYVQKMSDPNGNPADRIKGEYWEQVIIPSSQFASLSAIAIANDHHSKKYRRSNRSAFNDASGQCMHREERELVRWEGDSENMCEFLEDDDSESEFDQFAANNIDCTFDESVWLLYTTKIDTRKSKKNKQWTKEAAEKEYQIMKQETTNRHVRDDRAYYSFPENGTIANRNVMVNGQGNEQRDVQRDGDEDEEYAFSRVISRVISHDLASDLSVHDALKSTNDTNGFETSEWSTKESPEFVDDKMGGTSLWTEKDGRDEMIHERKMEVYDEWFENIIGDLV